MFHTNGNQEEYVAESYSFNSDEEEAVLDEEENIIITALFQAIEDGNQNLVNDLFSAYEVDINKPNFEANNGELMLHVACGFGNASIVELLIQNNAQVNLTDTHGDAAIHASAREGHSHIVRLLYENGANINLQNKSGETAVHVATRFDHVDTIRQLIKCGANVNLIDEHGETALHVAAFFGFPKIVDVLGEVGINTNVQNNELQTALHIAAVRGHFECVRCLLETGVNLNLLDKSGETALLLSLRRHHTEIALYLIKYKCNTNIQNNDFEQTALHIACATNQKKVVDQLCKVGCNLNVQNVFRETPLHLAIKSKNLKITRRLCAAGCDLSIANSSGALPKDLIQSKAIYEQEDNDEKIFKEEITNLISTLMDPIIRCKLVAMLKPVLSFYDKCVFEDSVARSSMQNNKSSKNFSNCATCNSIVENTVTKRSGGRCCNNSTQCVRTVDPSASCCNSVNGVEQHLTFRSIENLDVSNLISTIPKQLLKFNLKVLGNCSTGKSTLIETLKLGFLEGWWKSTTSTNKTNSSRSLNTNQYSSFNYSSKSNGLSDKTVLSSISTLISSKSSLGGSSPHTPHSNSAINSINNSSTSILSINSDYMGSNNSSSLNLNEHLNNLNNNLNGNLNGNHSNGNHIDHSNQFNTSKNRKNSAINSDICNLKMLSKEFSVSDGLHPFELSNKQDLNKFFTSFDLLDSKFGLNGYLNGSNHANHKLDCTLGIQVQSVNVPNVGDLTIFDFSGHHNYLQIYSKFLNDQDEAFYLVCFNACEPFDKWYTQSCYWLDLIKSVMRIRWPINFEGHLNRKMNVCLVATHRDLALKKSYNEFNLKNLNKNIIYDLDRLNLRLSTDCLDNLSVLHSLLRQKYENVFELGDCVHLLDARLANSNEIKLIKKQLENYKSKFVITLQPITHFLEEVIHKLSNLRKESFNSPIISYTELVSLIRNQINILVEDEHVEYVCQQLEKLGEIRRLRNRNHFDIQDDLIIYGLKWLTSDVIGNLLSCSYLENNGKVTGHYCVEDLQNLFPDIDALDLFLILENLELCTPCETEGNFLYLFPSFIQLERPDISWQSDEPLSNDHSPKSGSLDDDDRQQSQLAFNPNFVYVGLRIQCDENCYPKHLLVCLFPRIQILLERCFQQNSTLSQNNATNELKLLHWCNGLRISYLDLEAIISLGFLASLEYDSIEIKVRSSKEHRIDCFRLFELLVNLIEQYINTSFPNLQLQRSYYSPFELNCKKKFLHRYSTEELSHILFRDKLNNETGTNKSTRSNNDLLGQKIRNDNCDLEECLADIVSCGICEIDQLYFKSNNFLVNIVKEFLTINAINSKNSLMNDDQTENGDHSLSDAVLDEEEEDFRPKLITNFTVFDLDLLMRQALCKMFDQPDQIGVDWCMLSIKLNLTEKLPILDSKRKCHQSTSPTWRLIEEFGKESNCTLELLLMKMNELNRKNAIEMLLKCLPIVKIFPTKNSKFVKFKPPLAC